LAGNALNLKQKFKYLKLSLDVQGLRNFYFRVKLWREQRGILIHKLCITCEAADFINVLLTDLSGNGQTKALRNVRLQKKRHRLVSAGGVKVVQTGTVS
jgi:phosphoribosylformimino-5-aminoimidazole carboxamide ribonucleotide (ProFAR) isomerase